MGEHFVSKFFLPEAQVLIHHRSSDCQSDETPPSESPPTHLSEGQPDGLQ